MKHQREPSNFSTDVLKTTLGAVRQERRRRQHVRCVMGGALVLGLMGLSLISPRETAIPVVAAEVSAPTITVFASADVDSSRLIEVWSPRDFDGIVEEMTDTELTERLAHHPHASYLAANGKRRIIIPRS